VFGFNKDTFNIETIIDEALHGGTLIMENVLNKGNSSADLMSRLGEMYHKRVKRGARQWARNMFTYALQHFVQSDTFYISDEEEEEKTEHCYWYELAEDLGYDLGLPDLAHDVYETLKRKTDLESWQEIEIFVEKTLKHLDKEGLLDINHIKHAGVISRLLDDEMVRSIDDEFIPSIGENLRKAIHWLKEALKKDEGLLAPMDFLREIAEEVSYETLEMYNIGLEPESRFRTMLMETIRSNGELVADRMTRRKGGAIIQHGPLRDKYYVMPVSPLEERVIERLGREGIKDYIPGIKCHYEGMGLWEHYDKSLFEICELNLEELRSLDATLKREISPKQRRKILDQRAAKQEHIDGRYERAVDNMFPIDDAIHAVIDPRLFPGRVYRKRKHYLMRALKTFFGNESMKTTDNVNRKTMMMQFLDAVAPQLASQIRWAYKDMNPGNIGGIEPLMGDWEGLKPVTHYTEDLAIMLGFVHPLIEAGEMSSWEFPEVHSPDQENELLSRFYVNWHRERNGKYASLRWDRFLMDFTMADLAKKLNLIGHEHYKLRERIPLLDKDEKRQRWHDHSVYGSEWYRAVAVRNIHEALERPEFRKGYDKERRVLEAFAGMLESLEFIYPERPRDTGLVIVESGLVREDY